MRLLAPRLSACVAIAGIICLSSTFALDNTATENDITMPEADVNAPAEDGGFEVLWGKKHPHRKKKHPKYDKRVLNLVCDHIVIDKLVCKVKCAPHPILHGQSEAQALLEAPIDAPLDAPLDGAPLEAPLDALNNGKVTNVYIIMDEPCSKDLPPLCAAAIEAASKESEESEEMEDPQAEEADPEDEVDPKDEANLNDEADLSDEADLNDELDEDTDAGTDTDLWKKKHSKNNNHHRQRHGKHHHHQIKNPIQPGNPVGSKKPKHPYENLCVAVGEFCGDKLYGCKFDFKTRYYCKAVGEKPVVILPNALSCGGTDDGGKCNCKSTNPVCGSTLDPSCKANPNAIYHCPNGVGTKYEIFKICSHGTKCTTDKHGNAHCGSDPCKCASQGKVCGSTFPVSCGLDKNTLYICKGKGSKPVKLEVCEKGCIVHAGDSSCAGKCQCPISTDGKPVCGSSLDPSCKADPNTIYYCPKGDGTAYEIYQICNPGTKCNKDKNGNANCGSNTCQCQGNQQYCSSFFPDKCGLKPNSIYKCSNTGKPTFVSTCDGDHTCVTLSDGATCANNNCKCSVDGTVCGAGFPPSCTLSPTSLYTCKTGKAPVLIKNCAPNRCTSSETVSSTAAVFEAADASDSCSDSCTCTSQSTVCGSTFPVSCGLDQNTLYSCKGQGSKPSKSEVCQGGCVVNAGDNSCAVSCKCPISKSGQPVCGGALDPTCNLDPTVIYYCPGSSGSGPQVLKKCLPGTQCNMDNNGDANCGYATCSCSGDVVACSEQYPAECKLVPNSIYKCNSKGVPVIVKTCSNAQECVSVVDNALCGNKNCKCPYDGNFCGNIFPLSCLLLETTIYSCKKGQDPVVNRTCTQGTCSTTLPAFQAAAAVFGEDQCISACTCVANAAVCGSTFSPTCGLDTQRIYQCSGSGSSPTPGQLCSDTCLAQAGGAVCSTAADKCKCKKVGNTCGSDFDPSCNLLPNQLYTCTALGANPSGGVNCPNGCSFSGAGVPDKCNTETTRSCLCQKVGNTCGSVFPLGCVLDGTRLYTCNATGAIPIPGVDCLKGCTSRGLTGADTCTTTITPPNCNCTKTGDTCGATFAPACNLNPSQLYTCTGAGTAPTPGDICANGCTNNGASPDTCNTTPPNCNCVKTGSTCGSTFAPSCGLIVTELYTCTAGAPPAAGTECTNGCTNNGPSAPDTCSSTTPNCNCTKTGATCGSDFVPACNLVTTELYTCTAAGAVPTTGTNCTNGCTNNGATAADTCNTSPVNCNCVKTGSTCGSTFDPSCGYVSFELYTCTAGAPPTAGTECTNGCTNNGPSAPDTCSTTPPNCNCTKTGDTCGATFAPACNLNPNELYTCTGAGTAPTPGDICANGCTNNGASPDTCNTTPPNCNCVKTGSTCGSTFAPSCGLIVTELYTCTAGSAPTASTNCTNGCANNGPTAPDTCNGVVGPNCNCTKTGDTCGATFAPACNLNPNQLYTCTGAGITPTPGDVCANGCTNNGASPDTCNTTPPNCNCVKTGSTCGSTFAPSCGLIATELYTCTAGAPPTAGTECTNGCTNNGPSTPDTCSSTTPNCNCTKTGATCGSDFVPACNLVTTELYTCTAAGAVPTAGTNCTNGCTNNGATAADTCNTSPVNCNCVKTGSTCGSTFDPSCGYVSFELYTCTAGAPPTAGTECTNGCTNNGPSAPDTCSTTPPNCNCTKTGDTCGATFAPACNLNPNELYTCTGAGTAPTPGDICANGCTNNGASPDTCNTTPPNCNCVKTGSTCGSTFAPSCGLIVTELYTCTAGSAPTASTNCTNGCANNGPTAPDTCNGVVGPNCNCTKTGDTCGATFAPACNLNPSQLYTCTGAGTTPTPGDVCANGCTNNGASPDTCNTTPPNCNCVKTGSTCGSTFAPSCGLIATELYTCTAGAPPTAGTECTNGCTNNGPSTPDTCSSTTPNCNCTKTGATCGSDFVPACNLVTTELYTCTAAGAVPTAGTNCTNGCTNNGATAADTCNTSPVNCNCVKTGSTCGSTFDPSCGYVSFELYTCTAGAPPTAGTECTNGCTNNGPSAPDTCSTTPPNCNCTKTGDTCGATFAPACNLNPNELYTCTGAGTAPTPGDICANGCTNNGASPDTCNTTPPNCNCVKTGSTCGSTFAPSCGLIVTELYTCTAGSAPTASTNCTNGCANNGPTAPDTCNGVVGPNCNCTKTGDTCGATFAPACNLNPNQLYTCTGAGITPTPGDVCANGCTNNGASPDTCNTTPPNCNCVKTGSTCGSTFAPSCGLIATELYTCTAGAPPTAGTECTNGCTNNGPSTPDTCSSTTPNCNCTKTGATCGSDFVPACNLVTTELYTCTAAGAVPTTGTNCTNGCTNNGATAADTCNTSPVNCNCVKTGSTCGSTFDPSCGYVSFELYTCTAGAPPTAGTECTNGCTNNGPSAPDTCSTTPPNCNCTKTGDTCGATFAPACNLNPNELYTCTGAGTAPTPGDICANGCTNNGASPDTCNTTPPNCNCVKTGNTCGSTFAPSCGLIVTELYTCTAGSAPTASTNCTNGCANNGPTAPDTCNGVVGPNCNCTKTGDTCGATFAPACNLNPNQLYTCTGAGATPTPGDVCANGCTNNGASPDTCNTTPPNCNCVKTGSTCGSTFAPSCGLIATELYTCTAGAPPTAGTECTNGCTNNGPSAPDTCSSTTPNCNCTKTGATCGSDFVPACNLVTTELYTCTAAGAVPTTGTNCTNGCTNNGATAADTCNTSPVNCNCVKTGSTCGSTFDPSCGYVSFELYTCTAGAPPTAGTECTNGCTNNGPSAPDTCSTTPPNCNCTKTGDTCGATFAPACNLNPNELYTCTGAGTAPTPGDICANGCTNNGASPDTCNTTPPNCNCVKTGNTCGSTFAPSCGLIVTELYTCTAGSAPTASTNCTNGCANNGPTAPDTCNGVVGPNCNCTKTGDTCGATFAPACNLNPSQLYTCTGAGTTPTPGDVCANGCTNNGASPDTCNTTPPNCNCVKTGNTCGSTFAPSCGLIVTELYTCTAGAPPTASTNCTNGCTNNGATAPDTCNTTPVNCNCTKTGDTCGATFPPSCNLNPSQLYTCTAGGTPAPGDICANGCTNNGASPDTCNTTPPNCNCTKTGNTCGSTFDPSCGLIITELYACTPGATPSPVIDCTNGCTNNGPTVADTCNTTPVNCNCTKTGDTCGATFPPACNLNPSQLYTCTAGGTPTPGDVCANGCTNNGASPDTCNTTPPNCNCVKTGNTCGSTFAPSCGLIVTELYTCTAGAPPTASTNCTNGCTNNGATAPDTCNGAVTNCNCTKAATTCGSTFDPSCNLVATELYTCSGVGAVPVASTNCTNGCTSSGTTAADTCNTSPVNCNCTKAATTCGSTFDPSCNLIATELYTCSGVGAVPVASTNCANGCTSSGTTAADTCNTTPVNCNCTKAATTCGSTFDPSCNLVATELYTCASVGAVPVASTNCANGCTNNGATVADTCNTTPVNCNCTKAATTCGSTFDPSCNLVATELYTCASVGAVPVASTNCANGCTNNGATVADTCNTTPVNCNCTKAATTCGSTFDPSCNLVATELYTCSGVGAVPVASTNCANGCTSSGTTAADTCNTTPVNCNCTKAATTCGSTFDPSCNLVATELYTCASVGAVPVASTNCTNGCTNNGATVADTCNTTPVNCNCTKAATTCGSTFDPSCNLVATELYTCSGVGAVPVASTNCTNGCTSSGTTAADTCNTTPVNCNCTKAATTCGSTFDPSCNLVATELYTCASVGAVPVASTNCTNGCTNNGATVADTCNTTAVNCNCTTAFNTCGSAFDPSCNLSNNTLYTCTAVGAAPVVNQTCTGLCVPVAGANSVCQCLCTDSGTVCGSAFDPSCNLTANTLYTCTNGSAPVVSQDCDPGTCSSNIENSNTGNSVSSDHYLYPVDLSHLEVGDFEAMALTDFCIGQCACQVANATVCSDSYPATCNYTNGTLFNCASIGATPTVAQNCTSGCALQSNGTDACNPNPCACQKAGLSCSSSFPANCSYTANTLYTCTGPGALPTNGTACSSSTICTVVPGGDDICGTDTNCACVGTGTVCGSSFPPSCNLTATSVYTCPAGTETPCATGCADGQCPAPGCLCTVTGNVCGSSFAPSCNLEPNALYTCATGQAPVLDTNCGAQACVGSVCQDPCLCTSSNLACGSTFPASCNLTSTALYTCTAAGSTPSFSTNCSTGCELSQPNNECINPCVQQAAAAVAALNAVVQSLTTTLAATTADNVSVSELPNFINLFTGLANNLTAASSNYSALTAIAASELNTANSTFLILQNALSQVVFLNTTNALLAPVNTTLEATVLSTLTALVNCTNSTSIDCTALNNLYQSFVSVANTALSTITTPVPDQRVGAASGSTATFSAQFATAVAEINDAIATVNQTELDAAGLLLNQIIGLASNTQYGSASNVMILVYESAGYAAGCAGLNVTEWLDICNAYNQRTQGYLADLVNLVNSVLGQIPIVGPYVVTPVLSQLSQLLVDAQTGIATAAGGILSATQILTTLIDAAGPSASTTQIANFLLGGVGITNPPPQCTQPSGCEGVILAFEILLNATYTILDAIPVFGTTAVSLLQPVTTTFLNDLSTATGTTIAGIANTLTSAISGIIATVSALPLIGSALTPITNALNTLVSAADSIATCYTTGN